MIPGIKYTPQMFQEDCIALGKRIIPQGRYNSVYGVPRGGVAVATALSWALGVPLVDAPRSGTLICDDLVDSGHTRKEWEGFDFAALMIKSHTPRECFPTFYVRVWDGWVDFFWEAEERPVEDHITRLLEFIGENPNRKGMKETPTRMVKSWEEIFGGYKQDVKDVFKVFDDEEEKFGGLVYLKSIEFYSTCEHHWLPFSGQAFIAYIPNGPVIGASKLARVLDVFSRRFQMQERIGEQVTNALMEYLKPMGAACLTEAKHLCMACRGVKKQHSMMGYSSLKGVFLEHSAAGIAARNELMMLWGKP